MSPSIAAILTNKEVIAVDQDKLGRQGAALPKDGGDRQEAIADAREISRAKQ